MDKPNPTLHPLSIPAAGAKRLSDLPVCPFNDPFVSRPPPPLGGSSVLDFLTNVADETNRTRPDKTLTDRLHRPTHFLRPRTAENGQPRSCECKIVAPRHPRFPLEMGCSVKPQRLKRTLPLAGINAFPDFPQPAKRNHRKRATQNAEYIKRSASSSVKSLPLCLFHALNQHFFLSPIFSMR